MDSDMKDFEQSTDKEIIKGILDGNTVLFEILIRRYNSSLYKTGRAYSYNHQDTQDLMQDTFIDAYTNLAGFENRSSFKTWLHKIMLNNCFRKKQKSSYKNEIPHELTEAQAPLFSGSQEADLNGDIMNRELNSVIENALQNVPHEYRLVFSLREINGMNTRETAAVLEITESNVKVRLNRAKVMIRKEVEKSYSSAELYSFHLSYCDAMVNRVMTKLKLIKDEKQCTDS